jgi:predicted nucleic acid-binding protein
VILLDTSAVLLLIAGHRRSRPLARHAGRLAFTPIALLELRFLEESGRGVFLTPSPDVAVVHDPRWTVDDPPLHGVVAQALTLAWTRDPFDRLIAGHALYRGWRLATSDGPMLEHLPARATLAL